MEKRICVICGEEYKPIIRKQETCGDKKCVEYKEKKMNEDYLRQHPDNQA